MKLQAKTSAKLLAIPAALALSVPALAVPLTVDGRLSDWGVRLGDNNTSNISVPLAPSTVNAVPLTCFGGSAVCEDQNDRSNNHAVGPHYGGQNYDVEFLGLRYQGGRIFIGIASGLRPDNGFSLYAPGDLFLNVNGVEYAIEIGGGAGGAAASSAPLLGGGVGSTYTLNSSGYTTGVAAHAVAQTAGSIWRASAVDYLTDPITHTVNTQFTLKPGTTASAKVGIADFAFTRNQTPDTVNGGNLTQHSVIELSFEAALIGGASDIEIEASWGPVCSNDGLEYYGRIPEPSSIALLAIGLAGFGAARRRPN